MYCFNGHYIGVNWCEMDWHLPIHSPNCQTDDIEKMCEKWSLVDKQTGKQQDKQLMQQHKTFGHVATV